MFSCSKFGPGDDAGNGSLKNAVSAYGKGSSGTWKGGVMFTASTAAASCCQLYLLPFVAMPSTSPMSMVVNAVVSTALWNSMSANGPVAFGAAATAGESVPTAQKPEKEPVG